MTDGNELASGTTVTNGRTLASGIEMTNGSGVAKSHLKSLHDTQVSVEKFRISLSNRVSALSRGVDDAERPVPAIYADLARMADEMEAQIDKEIARGLADIPVWDHWLSHVKGVGPSLAGQMLALLLPPAPLYGPSSWYKAAGLAPEQRPDGLMRLPRARAGEGKITYHPWLRRCLWNLATSFVRNGGYYRTTYEARKAELVAAHSGDEQWPLHRLDSVARWKMVKLFLAHLWERWLEAEGQGEGRRAYVIDKLGHHYQAPPEWSGNGKI